MILLKNYNIFYFLMIKLVGLKNVCWSKFAGCRKSVVLSLLDLKKEFWIELAGFKKKECWIRLVELKKKVLD